MKIGKKTIAKKYRKGRNSILPHLILKKIGYTLHKELTTKDWDKYLMDSKLVGPPGAHSRENILRKINSFIEKQQRREDGHYGLGLPILEYNQTFDMVIKACDNAKDPKYTEGQDWVSLNAFKKSMLSAVEIAGQIARQSGVVLMATGHPESLPPAYTYMGKCLVEKGASLYNPSIYPLPSEDRDRWLGSICGVTMLFEGAGVRHTHDDCGLDKILLKEGVRPDLIIADHGLAAAGIRAQIPTIAIVDTNDTELIVASCTYPDRVFPIPIHDNAGIESSMAMAYYFEYLMEEFA